MDFSNIQFPKSVLVTDQEIDVSSLNEKQKQFYIDFFRELVEYYSSAGKPRVIVGLAGPVGSGKSVTAALCKYFAGQMKLPFRFETLGIDALHYYNHYLWSHTSGGIALKDVKGRFDTYDVAKLIVILRNFAEEKDVSLPAYSRITHDPVEDAAIIVEKNALLLVEGQWLLYDKAGWEAVAPFFDFSYFIEADKEKLRDAVIARHARGGRTLEDAAQYFDEVDSQNFDLIAATKSRADKIVPSYCAL